MLNYSKILFLAAAAAGQGVLLLQSCCVHGFTTSSSKLNGPSSRRNMVKHNLYSRSDEYSLRRIAPPVIPTSFIVGRTLLWMSGNEKSDDKHIAPLFEDKEVSKLPSFGDSVSIRNRPKKNASVSNTTPLPVAAEIQRSDREMGKSVGNDSIKVDNRSEERIVADNLIRRNKMVAFVSITLAVASWLWQVAHPVTPIQLLADMEARSADISVLGHNGKPTVVDFWAPWCESCKLSAATMHAIEAEYSDRVNFITINGDDMVRNGKLVEAFGVDAIPHIAMVEADGTVDTALIGPIPKRILRANLDVLIENSSKEVHDILPYTMLDVFENRPQDRRLSF